MKIREAENYIVEALKQVYDEGESGNIAHLVLESCSGFSLSQLRMNKERVWLPV